MNPVIHHLPSAIQRPFSFLLEHPHLVRLTLMKLLLWPQSALLQKLFQSHLNIFLPILASCNQYILTNRKSVISSVFDSSSLSIYEIYNFLSLLCPSDNCEFTGGRFLGMSKTRLLIPYIHRILVVLLAYVISLYIHRYQDISLYTTVSHCHLSQR
jgi:hypothetical protein